MADIKPFLCIRPCADKAKQIAALPYDVYNREEAKREVEKNGESFLAIDRAEVNFSEEVDTYADCVYEKARDLLWKRIKEGDFIQEEEDCYFLYELTMDGRSQTGLVACASIDDYENQVIKKHENTRLEKEMDRIRHVDTCNAQTGPIFLAYRRNDRIQEIVEKTKADASCLCYDFVSEDGIRHRIFRIANQNDCAQIQAAFHQIQEIYIADGHHRAASAVKVGLKRRAEMTDYDGSEEFNYFLSVLFPDEELKIMDYNRVVMDLNGFTSVEFLEKVKEIFLVEEERDSAFYPEKKGEITMYLNGKWYLLQVRKENQSEDPVEGLDVSLLQNLLLNPVLGIQDPKTDHRIDFVGGIRGLKELERRVENGAAVAFAMYPTSIQELFAVADANRLMPPKSTWFEPKLRSGLFIHALSGRIEQK